ncbi:hypothetical protein AMECASPLE_029532 [Ameca splendens]|uniref:Uncharacterized protein n=1 Tax=Ameca splendens TaxID=208324 RepID=A0ABV1A171_9TELE
MLVSVLGSAPTPGAHQRIRQPLQRMWEEYSFAASWSTRCGASPPGSPFGVQFLSHLLVLQSHTFTDNPEPHRVIRI